MIVAVVSGGMDSITLAHYLRAQGHDLLVLSVNYGQRHHKELRYARKAAAALEAEHLLVDLVGVGPALSGSSLTDPSVPVPEGHYAQENMRQTVVPNRNAIMLSVASGVAVARGASGVATAVHSGDHWIYPDCRPAFIKAFDAMVTVATDGFAVPDFKILAPFLHMSKADIVACGTRMGVPWEETWSCYLGGAQHCGSCGTCFERREAFVLAGVPDPTAYDATPTFDDPRVLS